MQKESALNRDVIAMHNNHLATLLFQSLDLEHRINFDQLKNTLPFEQSDVYALLKARLDAIRNPAAPKQGILPPEPFYLEPQISLGNRLLFKKKAMLQAAAEAHKKKQEAWLKLCEKVDLSYSRQVELHKESLEKIEAERAAILEEIEIERKRYEDARHTHNEISDLLQINYRSMKPAAVEDYLRIGMQQNTPAAPFTNSIDLEYHRENHLLLVSMELPHPDLFLKQMDETSDPSTKQSGLTENTRESVVAIYDDACYQFILSTLHMLFTLDEEGVVDAVKLQAWVRCLNKGNGQLEKICIASLYTGRDEFQKINLRQVDAAQCFRYLKGSSAPSLADLVPVQAKLVIAPKNHSPVLNGNALKPLPDGQHNLATMPWVEFEKLLTGLFRSEFGQLEDDLDIIHSSPEQGLDAMGTDTDLFRGGKILFLAKRGNKPLPVSIVRELFGMVIHEGAIKGILITTTDFTQEAYAFAQQKPLTLVNGNSLLRLFEKHGQQFRINLREAVSLASLLS